MNAPSLFGNKLAMEALEVPELSPFFFTMQRGILVLENYPNVYKYHVSVNFIPFAFA